jgi:ParB-like nuclease domain
MSSAEVTTNPPVPTQVIEVPLHLIKPSKSNPRKSFDDLNDLANSIRQNGVQQPLLVRPHPTIAGSYDLVAGERRWRASKLAEKATAPCIVRALSDEDALDLQMVENIQREEMSPRIGALPLRCGQPLHAPAVGFNVASQASKGAFARSPCPPWLLTNTHGMEGRGAARRAGGRPAGLDSEHAHARSAQAPRGYRHRRRRGHAHSPVEQTHYTECGAGAPSTGSGKRAWPQVHLENCGWLGRGSER